ncbi:hypothetical protein ACFOG5_06695 [Pedobacter fastidiosus]|uniref:DUF3575 domain-containing protein n=1 Tax=Pedobacter fastidiosus TaxID=2765361 RepID=A0ABR7KVU2_9SPHI|nr:hypothetical protein [Pedobacter fastidiosus]MBC6111877.1 hypothetical protein [Pedobacter fastidiosus]
MKNFIFVLAILLPLGNSFAQSGTIKERKNVIMIGLPLNLIDNNTNESYFLFDLAFKVSYEHRLSQNFTPYIQLGYQGPRTYDLETAETQEKIKTSGINLQIGNKFFFNNTATPAGFYMSPQFTFNSVKLKEEGSVPGGYIRIKDYGLAGIIGYQMVRTKGFAMSVYTGASIFRRNYFDNTLIESAAVIDHNETGIRPYLGMQFGYAF